MRDSYIEFIKLVSAPNSIEKTPIARENESAPKILFIGAKIPAIREAAAKEPEIARIPTKERLFTIDTHIPHTQELEIPPSLAEMRMKRENKTELNEISKSLNSVSEIRTAETKNPAPEISSRENEEYGFFRETAEKNFEKKYVLTAQIRDSQKYINALFLMALLTSEIVIPVEKQETNERIGA